MTTKERLIEELKKYNWFIDTYEDFNRVAALKSILLCYTNKLINNYGFLASPCRWVGSIDKSNEVIFLVEVDSQYIDINQLFNEYLEEYEHHVWQHSVLSAMQLGLKVEHQELVSEYSNSGIWWETNTLIGIGSRLDIKYRINHEEQELVPDEVWEVLNPKYKYIAKDHSNNIRAFTEKPKLGVNAKRWYGGSGDFIGINGLTYLCGAKINDVDWKESLCVRPKNNKG